TCCSTGAGPSSLGGSSWTTVSPDATAVPHSGQNLLFAGSFAPQVAHLARGMDALLGRRRRRLQRAQRLGHTRAQRPDELQVVLVRDLARPMVELELLERRERAVTLLRELERAPLEGARLVETVLRRIRLADEGQRDEDDARDGEDGADRERERAHARASGRSSR